MRASLVNYTGDSVLISTQSLVKGISTEPIRELKLKYHLNDCMDTSRQLEKSGIKI